MDVEFYDLSYMVPTFGRNSPPKTILSSLSGNFPSGKLSAIMGPSGAGKSSLLNAVSGFTIDGVSALFKINGVVRDPDEFHKTSCYITQDDRLQPSLTVYELMKFASKLKLRKNVSFKKRETVIKTILTDLGLIEHQATPTQNLSGGQKKRLSIALELINNPPIFFLDEPTSGLDDFSTKYCIKLLRRLARQGRTIVCTIHQPSAKLFALFDHVYIVARGQCVYQGDTQSLVPFLSSVGLECPLHYNPADYIIELTDGDNTTNIGLLSDKIENGKICQYSIPDTNDPNAPRRPSEFKIDETVYKAILYDKSKKKDKRKASLASVSSTTTRCSVHYPISKWLQFVLLFTRMMKQIIRNRTAIQIQFIHYMLCASTFSAMFYNTSDDGSNMFLHLKFCMGIVLFITYTQLMIQVLLLPTEIQLVRKEMFNRWYAYTPYYAALTLSKIPLQFTLNFLFITMVYFFCGLPMNVYRFCSYVIVANLVSLIAEGIGFTIGSIFKITNGCAVGTAVIAPLLGLAVHGVDYAREVPPLMHIVMKFSFMRDGFIALLLSTFGFNRAQLHCNDVYCHFDQPDVVLDFLYLQGRSVSTEVYILCALLIIIRLCSYLTLKQRFVQSSFITRVYAYYCG